MNDTHQRQPLQKERSFSFTWYHREEIQVLALLVGLIVFFARSLWVLGTLASFVFVVLGLLYLTRILERYLERRKMFLSLVRRYQDLKTALHGHSVERSRIAMALLSAWILGVLCIHRVTLAQADAKDATPTDIYWILFLGWYCIACTVIALYLMWLWNAWSQNELKHQPFLDGFVASLFFYRGLARRKRIATYIATFFLGGLPSFVAIRLTPETPYGYQIACALTIPLIGLVLGGAFYAMKNLREPVDDTLS